MSNFVKDSNRATLGGQLATLSCLVSYRYTEFDMYGFPVVGNNEQTSDSLQLHDIVVCAGFLVVCSLGVSLHSSH